MLLIIAEKAYMHKYVYEDEPLTPKNVQVQIDNLIDKGIITILDEDNSSHIDRIIYDETKNKLKKYMIGTLELILVRKWQGWYEAIVK